MFFWYFVAVNGWHFLKKTILIIRMERIVLNKFEKIYEDNGFLILWFESSSVKSNQNKTRDTGVWKMKVFTQIEIKENPNDLNWKVLVKLKKIKKVLELENRSKNRVQ